MEGKRTDEWIVGWIDREGRVETFEHTGTHASTHAELGGERERKIQGHTHRETGSPIQTERDGARRRRWGR